MKAQNDFVTTALLKQTYLGLTLRKESKEQKKYTLTQASDEMISNFEAKVKKGKRSAESLKKWRTTKCKLVAFLNHQFKKNGDEQTLTAKTSGVVNIVRSGLYSGSPVGAGQPLFTISSKGFTDNNANVELQQARNNLAKAKIDFERNSDLYSNLISETLLKQVRAGWL